MELELCAMAPYGEPPSRERVLIEAQRYTGEEAVFAELFRQLLHGAGLSYPVNKKVRLHLPGGHWIPIDTTDEVVALDCYIGTVNADRKAWVPKAPKP